MMTRRLILALTIAALCVAVCASVARGGKAHHTPDRRVIDGIHIIQTGIQKYAADNNDVYPPGSAVEWSGAVGSYVDHWPTNPWTGLPMVQSIQKGDFTYRMSSTSYTLAGHLSNGSDFTVP
jgi:hypothetical protein